MFLLNYLYITKQEMVCIPVCNFIKLVKVMYPAQTPTIKTFLIKVLFFTPFSCKTLVSQYWIQNNKCSYIGFWLVIIVYTIIKQRKCILVVQYNLLLSTIKDLHLFSFWVFRWRSVWRWSVRGRNTDVNNVRAAWGCFPSVRDICTFNR